MRVEPVGSSSGIASVALAAAIALVAPFASAQSACPDGQTSSADTVGHCCWPGQAWSTLRQVCVGLPECPQGYRAEGEICSRVCPDGQAINPDTSGHCCWPQQAWSSVRSTCVGVPACPTGMQAQGEACVSQTIASPSPPPPTVSQPVVTEAPATPTPSACGAGTRWDGEHCVPTQAESPSTNAASAAPSQTPPAGPSTETAAPAPRRIPAAAIAVMGGGLVLLGIGGVTWAVSDANYGALRTRCNMGACPPDARQQISGVRTLDTVADAFLVSGTVALTVGAITAAWLWARGSDTSHTPVPTVAIAPGAASLVVRTVF